MGASSSRARTTSCSRWAARTPGSTATGPSRRLSRTGSVAARAAAAATARVGGRAATARAGADGELPGHALLLVAVDRAVHVVAARLVGHLQRRRLPGR